MKATILLLAIAFQLGAASPSRILSACDDSAAVLGTLAPDSPLTVHSAVSGGAACYTVTATIDDKPVRGYMLDADVEAIRVFEIARVKFLREVLSAPPVMPPPPPAPVAAAPAPSVAKPEAPVPAQPAPVTPPSGKASPLM